MIISVMLKSLLINAQITEVVSVDAPYGIAISGNILYYTSFENKIFKVDLGMSNSSAIEVISGLNGSDGILIDGNYLYIAEYSGNKISKINITETNPVLIDVVTGLNNPTSMIINNNYLYISEFGGNKISKMDLNDVDATLSDLVSITRPYGLAINGNELYISETGSYGQPESNKILKINITETNPTITTVLSSSGSWSLSLVGNDLYYTVPSQDKISKINITFSNPTPVDVVTLYDSPYDLTFNGNELYFSSFGGDNISKSSISSLSLNEVSNSIKASIFPNPSNEFIHIDNIESEINYRIYNLLGEEVFSGVALPKEKIEIQELEVGCYFIKFDNTHSIKFIKK